MSVCLFQPPDESSTTKDDDIKNEETDTLEVSRHY